LNHVFAEVEPNQKERIILALKKAGNVVGYLGDGINDASALHAADVGLSVESAVDVAKESSDIVLLEKDLGVLANGVKEGRKTFANTLSTCSWQQAQISETFSAWQEITLSVISSPASQTDIAHQPDDRFPRDNHRHRQCG
jgi:P-type E1-E2 ATPase